jgi:hypothetical protein
MTEVEGAMTLRVGADIEAMCGKCGDVWHILVAMVEGKIVKVQCKECKAMHKYKPPPGKAPLDAMSRRAASRRDSEARPRAASSSGASAPRATSSMVRRPRVNDIPPPLVSSNDRPPQEYNLRETYLVGDRVTHPKFGAGLVEKDLGDHKIQVYFADGRRTLMHGK